MSSEDRKLMTEPELREGESTVTPGRIVIAQREGGAPTLGLFEGELEQRYGVGDDYSSMLFLALCRVHAVRAYRRPRLHRGTVCVKTTLTKHEALWRQFLEQWRRLDARLAEVTQQFVRDEIERRR